MEKENTNDKTVVNKTEIVGVGIDVIDEKTIKEKIYLIRGVKAMLDFELAEIYGYETKNFNRQVKNNAEKFEGDDFMFQMTPEELKMLSRCKNFTTIQTKGVKGGRTNLPYAFTESGVYMLMTVLKGDTAVKQSRALIRAFKAMKDYIVDNRPLIAQHDYLRLSMQVSDVQQAVRDVQNKIIDYDEKLCSIFEQLHDTVKSSEISPYMLDFARPAEKHEYLILNGEPAKADETYIKIYSEAKKTIYIVDNVI